MLAFIPLLIQQVLHVSYMLGIVQNAGDTVVKANTDIISPFMKLTVW